MTERASSPSEGTCAACGKALGSVIENHIHGQRLYHASCCPACRTTPEQAKVEQPSMDDLHFFLSRLSEQEKDIVTWMVNARTEVLMADRERDIRADMKREVLAEIASMLEVTHAIASPYDQPQQEKDRQTLRELKRRVDGL